MEAMIGYLFLVRLQSCFYLIMMKERKVWSEFEDKILRYLKEERGEQKWSVIARKMDEEFEIAGRTGKQCRERYHNHLDSSIVATEWTEVEDAILIKMHEEEGNKWSSISHNLPGRSDNCVKNRFYSKLRKSVRRLNKFIIDNLSEDQIVSPKLLSKIIETAELKVKSSCRVDEDTIQYSIDLKNRLFLFESCIAGETIETLEEVELARQLVDDILEFNSSIKKPWKPIRRRRTSFEANDNYLHPEMCFKVNRSISMASSASDNSEDASCLSSSYISSCFEEAVGMRKRSMTTRSTRDMKSRSNSDVLIIKDEEILSAGDPRDIAEFNHLLIDENEKLSHSLIEESGQQERKERERSQGSNSSGKSKRFKTFDAFCEINETFQCHLDVEQPLGEIVWRILQPKEKEAEAEVEVEEVIQRSSMEEE